MEKFKASGGEETREDKLKLYLDDAKECLKGDFGIDNLSINELFIIKKIVEDVLVIKERDEDEKTDLARINPTAEICSRFLIEAYGIDPHYINTYSDTDEDTEEFNEYIRRVRERAHLI